MTGVQTCALPISIVLGAHPSLPARNPKELVALSHARKGSLNFGSAGIGTSSHFAVELFKLVSKADLTHIPYKGAGPATIDAMAGFIPLVVDAITSMKPHLDGGKIKGIAIGSAQRSEGAPNLATFAESGYPGFEASSWWGILAPAKTPREIVEKVNADMNRMFNLPEVKERLAAGGADVMANMTPAQFGQFVRSEIEKNRKIIQASGVKAE